MIDLFGHVQNAEKDLGIKLKFYLIMTIIIKIQTIMKKLKKNLLLKILYLVGEL